MTNVGRTIALIQARVKSVRLPNKVLADLCGHPLLWHVVTRVSQARTLDGVVVATGDIPANDPIEAICQEQGWQCFRGSEDDVLDRFYQAARWARADVIVRVSGDCPLHSGEAIDDLTHFREVWQTNGHNLEYLTNAHIRPLPDGLDAELLTFDVLELAWRAATVKSDREHVTPWLRRCLPAGWWCWLEQRQDYSGVRLCVDEPADLEAMRAIMAIAGPSCDWRDAIRVLEERPDIAALNQRPELRNAAYIRQVKEEQGV